eukprot:gene3080-5250_t
MRILLLQIREVNDPTAKEEYLSFVRCSKLKEDNFVVHNVFEKPNFDENILEGHVALFIGGSSDASVLKEEEYSFVLNCKKLLIHCEKNNFPVFGSCFGFQLACEALGGEVIVDEKNCEMGCYNISLFSDSAKEDLLFHDTPNGFTSIIGHKERAIKLPENAILLASTELCPYHAFTLKDKPFYAFQFHPEMDLNDMDSRLNRYPKRYPYEMFEGEEGIRKSGIGKDLTDANGIVEKFVQRIIMEKLK